MIREKDLEVRMIQTDGKAYETADVLKIMNGDRFR